ncbi:uncharacterized protein LOC6618098 [Drosophila sechellia]|nr:uncharacterized protein LOC6618098 [Drosophila sechellia]
MEKYPLVTEFMGQNCLKDTQMAQFENELRKRKELIVEEQIIGPQLEQVLFDLTLAKQCALAVQNNGAGLAQVNTMVQDCIFQITRIEELLEMAGLQDILYYTMHRKEQEFLRIIKLQEDLAEQENQQNTILESRSIVQELRKEQVSKKEADKELASVDDQLDQADREWTITLRSMTDNRNKKIVSVLQMRKLINELKEELQKRNLIKTVVTKGAEPNLAGVLSVGSISSFQSASDFLNNFIFKNIKLDGNKFMTSVNSEISTKKLETPLRSILVKCKEDEPVAISNSPTKQVRFSPYPEISHIEEDKFEKPDWLSRSEEADVPNAELEEDADEIEATDEDFEEVSEEESDDEMEVKDEGFEQEEKVEKSEELLDPEQDRYDDKSGSEVEESVSDDKESGGEASGEEEPADAAKQVKFGEKPQPDDQPSNEISDKPQIIRVDTLSPIKNISSWTSDDIPTTSKGTLNRFTATQLMNYGSDRDANEESPSKRLKLEEDEFPMTQPMPDYFKHPSSTFNNFDDQSLRFSSPHNNFDDDYLLNFSDDSDVTPTAASAYIL